MTRVAAVVTVALVALLGLWTWLVLVSSAATYRVNGFRFEGPSSLERPSPSLWNDPESAGRCDPYFHVTPLLQEGIHCLQEDERSRATKVSGRDAVILEMKTFAPGHGGRDHDTLVYVPELRVGVNVYYRSHEEDSDAGLAEHFDAWRCRRWTEMVVSSLAWDPEE